jgi:predicted GIY-YIG superfamily endonuclease
MTRTALYRHRDTNGTLLYVGISLSVAARLARHTSTAHWFSEVARVDIEWLPTREAALVAERRAIRTEHPRCNVAHTRLLRTSPKVRRTSRVEPGLIAYTPERPVVNGTSFATAEEARRYLYRELFFLEARMPEYAEVYEPIREANQEALWTQSLGHRFWLRLTDDEFAAVSWGMLHDEARFLVEHCGAIHEDQEWLDAAESLWDLSCEMLFKWDSRRDELACRWPHLAAA